MAQPAMCRHDLNTIEGKSLSVLYNTESDKKEIDALSNNLNVKQKSGYIMMKHIALSGMIKKCYLRIGLIQLVNCDQLLQKNGKICSFAPPKSISYDDFKVKLNQVV